MVLELYVTSDALLQVALVDGVAFKDRGGDGKVLSEDELKSCFKLTNHRVRRSGLH